MSSYYRELRDLIGTRRIFNPAVVAIIPNQQGDILFVQEAGQSAWGIPAGAIEIGETPAEAVVREVYEETGLQEAVRQLLGVLGGPGFDWTYPDGNQVEYLSVVFLCEVLDGVLHPVDGEIQAYRWFHPEALPPLQFPFPRELFSGPWNHTSFFQTPD